MMPAAKHLDPVVGVDIHIILIPTPAGPVPTPLPHPFVGIIMDPFDYAPIIGATVFVGPFPRAQAGTAGIAVPPHIPMGGPFAKPPGNECEMFMGSTTVLVDDEPFSYLALPALSCHDIGMVPPFRPKKPKKTYSLVLPTSVVLPIPAGPPVLIGGPPTISLMALGMRFGMSALGKGLKKLRKMQKGSKRMAKISKNIKAKAKKAMDALGIPSNAQNKVNRAICKVTGHPVDVATGKVFTDLTDFELAGPINFLWERVWFSTSTYYGPLGHGWHNNYDITLFIAEDVVLMRLGDGRVIYFPVPNSGESQNLQEKLNLIVTDGEYIVKTEVGLQYHFARDGYALESDRRPEGLTINKIQDRNQCAIHFEYCKGKLVQIVDSAGRTLTIQHDHEGRISSVDGPHPNDANHRVDLVTYQYDQDGNLIKATDPCGNSYSYEYESHLLIRETDPNGVNFFFKYDGSDQLSRCVRTYGDGNILERKLRYDDALGQTIVADTKGNLTVHEWDERGVVTLTIDPMGNEHSKEYDEECRLVKEVNPCGETTLYAYGEDGRVAEIQEPDGGITRFQYGDRGELLIVEGPDGLLVERRYDGSGNLTGVCFPDGANWRFAVNQLGERVRTTDPEGRNTTFVWGKQGELISASDEEGTIFVATYDGWGRPLKSRSGYQGELEYRWDLVGNLLGTRDTNGSVHAFEYDRNCNLLAAKRPDGNVINYSYGPLGRVTKTEFPTGAKMELSYDNELNLKTILDPGGRSFILERDENGKVVSEALPDSRLIRYKYDQAGRLSERSDSTGRSTQWEYDKMGRVVVRRFSDGAEETFEHDVRGRVIKATNASVIVERNYDIYGNILAESINGATLKNSYDSVGNRTKRESPSGYQLQFLYDKRDRRSEIHMPCGTVVLSKFDGYDREIERFVPGGIHRSCEFDGTGKLLSCSLNRGEKTHASRAYKYDKAGRITQIDDSRRGKYQYYYDADGKLIKAELPSGETERYECDAAGNMDNAPSILGDKGLRTVSKDGRWNLEFDKAGQLVYKADSSVAFRFHYTTKAELFRAEKFAVDNEVADLKEPLSVTEFEYDPWGRRVSKTFRDREGKTDRRIFLWDHLTLLGEVGEGCKPDATPEKVEKEYFLDPDTFEPILLFDDGGIFISDCGQASEPLGIYTTNAEQVWVSDKSPFGSVGGERLEFDVPFGFAGQFHDYDTGLYYNWYRYYDPDLRIYTTSDPLGLEVGVNFWNYVDNPLMAIDPFGLVHETTPNYDVYALYDPPGPPPAPGAKPYYVGITDNQTRRAGEHANSGRLDKKGGGFMHPLDEGIDYGTARGYEQAYIEKYETKDTSARGKDMSKETRGNRCNSFDVDNTTRGAERQKHFKSGRKQKLKQLSPCG